MSNGFSVKPSNDVPQELLERFDIQVGRVIFHNSKHSNVAVKSFVLAETKMAKKIRQLLQTTKVEIIMIEEEHDVHEGKSECDLYKLLYSESSPNVDDHNHMSGKFRQTICNMCNRKHACTQKRVFR